jgi:methionyl-tRNA formyltransferase
LATIRTVFAGTPEFAVPALEVLLARQDIELAAVYTQPDRPAGRGQHIQASPIKRIAERAGLTVIQPENLKNTRDVKAFTDIGARLLVVVAYGLMLPAPFITAPVTAINVHASLLPRWRGAAPIQRALMAGDTVSGISIMRVVQRLDAGPVWLRRSCSISEDETYGSLHDKLARLGAESLKPFKTRIW